MSLDALINIGDRSNKRLKGIKELLYKPDLYGKRPDRRGIPGKPGNQRIGGNILGTQ